MNETKTQNWIHSKCLLTPGNCRQWCSHRRYRNYRWTFDVNDLSDFGCRSNSHSLHHFIFIQILRTYHSYQNMMILKFHFFSNDFVNFNNKRKWWTTENKYVRLFLESHPCESCSIEGKKISQLIDVLHGISINCSYHGTHSIDMTQYGWTTNNTVWSACHVVYRWQEFYEVKLVNFAGAERLRAIRRKQFLSLYSDRVIGKYFAVNRWNNVYWSYRKLIINVYMKN